MRNPISIEQIHISHYDERPTPAEISTMEKLKEWRASNYAGFRRALEKDSDCFPDISKIIQLALDRKEKFSHFVLLGTGGSFLGAETIIKALCPQHLRQKFHFADNNDPTWFYDLLHTIPLQQTLFFVVSKSGGTPETISQFMACMEMVRTQFPDSWKKHFVLCTDPLKSDLRETARRFDLACLDFPSAVGGRLSVLTAQGLFPAAFAGLNPNKFLEGALSVAELFEKLPFQNNPSFHLARAFVNSGKPITVMMPYSSALSAFSRWFCQLWAESTGKEGKGFTPFAAMGTTDQHSQMQLYMEGPKDKNIILIHVKDCHQQQKLHVPTEVAEIPAFKLLSGHSMWDLFEAEFLGTREAFTKQGLSHITLEIDKLDEYSLGALFYYWEWMTAVTGALMGINPFDQPGVEASKINTKRFLTGK